MTKKDGGALVAPQHAGEIQQYEETNPIGAMLNAIVEKGVSTENVAAMEKLVTLYERMEDRRAEQLFAAARNAMQAELPQVAAKRFIPNNDGSVRSTFAAFEDIMEAVKPFLNRHGFSVSFDVDVIDDGKRLQATCLLMHVGGHCKTNKFAVRIGSGPPKASEAQADGSARSYARRGALCDALNIVVDHDNDARLDGDAITKEQADDLRRRLKAVNGDEAAFLKFTGAESFETIATGRYDSVEATLSRKEREKAAKKPSATSPEDAALGEMFPTQKQHH